MGIVRKTRHLIYFRRKLVRLEGGSEEKGESRLPPTFLVLTGPLTKSENQI